MSDAHRDGQGATGSTDAEFGDSAANDNSPDSERDLSLDDVSFEDEARATIPHESAQKSDAKDAAATSPQGASDEQDAPPPSSDSDDTPGGSDPASPPKSTGIALQVAGRTDVGLVREHNEDNYLVADLSNGNQDPLAFHEVTTAGCLFAVCDGMGGAAAGEVASQMAVDTVCEVMREATPASDRDDLARGLVRAIETAGARIFDAARQDRSRRGMGTTSTVATLMDKTLFVGQVGDSRAYVLRRGELKQVTKDQSLVNQLIEAGQLTEDEAEAFEHSNIILQALGTTDQVNVDLTFLELRQKDRVLMCSDGLSGLVHADVIRDVMLEYEELDACCDRLIELAKAGGGHDNVTVILLEFDGDGLGEPTDETKVAYQQYPLPLADDASTAPGRGVDSQVPTYAPPGTPGSDAPGFGDPSAELGALGEDASGGSGKYLVLAVIMLLIAGGAYYWTGSLANQPPVDDTPPLPTAQQEPAPVEVVEVVVRTDVREATLYIDGDPIGAAQDDRWTVKLPQGDYELEARVGEDVRAKGKVNVRAQPATVFLSTLPDSESPSDGKPEDPSPGKPATAPDGPAEGTGSAEEAAAQQAAADKAKQARREARRRRREAARAAAKAAREEAPGGGTPPPAPE